MHGPQPTAAGTLQTRYGVKQTPWIEWVLVRSEEKEHHEAEANRECTARQKEFYFSCIHA